MPQTTTWPRPAHQINTHLRDLQQAIKEAGDRANRTFGRDRQFHLDEMWRLEKEAVEARCELSATYLIGAAR